MPDYVPIVFKWARSDSRLEISKGRPDWELEYHAFCMAKQQSPGGIDDGVMRKRLCQESLARSAATGIAAAGDEAWTIYQCDQCIRPWHFDGATLDVALTFALDADGNCFYPRSGEIMPPIADPGYATDSGFVAQVGAGRSQRRNP